MWRTVRSGRLDPQQYAVLAYHPHLGAGRQIAAGDQPQAVTGLDLAATANDGLVQDEAAADELAAAAIESRRIGELGRAALALPPEYGGEHREQGEHQELPGPGQLREQVGKHADRGCGDADPQQVAAGTE